jgi:5-methyltetrahydropteroyltriglutamate--homocysteine methyltransferase
MRHSSERILTTHVGSLPRPDDVAELLVAKEVGEDFDADAFEGRMDRAVAACVADQRAIGIDVINDGEIAKTGYATYIQDRLSGFSGDSPSVLFDDLSEFPDYRRKMGQAAGARRLRRPRCTGPIALADREPMTRDIARLQAAVAEAGAGAADVFMNAASPGVIAVFQTNEHYDTMDAYVEALSLAMRAEYEAIAGAGFVLQLDCPDLAMGRHVTYVDLDDDDFVRRAALLVEAMNAALENVPAEAARMHVCWGNYEGPHHKDIELARIIEVLLTAKPQGLSFEAANPRHAHEWRVFAEFDLPDDKVLIPGVVDSTTNYVEHPELVAERIARFADIVGRERVIASADCGFATFAGISKIDPAIARMKLEALVEGAAIASERLW